MKKAISLRAALAGAALFAALTGTTANAQQGSRMLNLSANSVISNRSDIGFITCAILQGSLTIAVFAEARAGSLDLDPGVQVRRAPFGPNDVIASNDDFGGLDAGVRNDIANAVGRAPNQDTDAAVLLTKNTTNTDSICVVAVDVVDGSSGGFVNAQIQQVSDSFATSAPVATSGEDYSTAQRFSEPGAKIDDAAIDALLQP